MWGGDRGGVVRGGLSEALGGWVWCLLPAVPAFILFPSLEETPSCLLKTLLLVWCAVGLWRAIGIVMLGLEGRGSEAVSIFLSFFLFFFFVLLWQMGNINLDKQNGEPRLTTWFWSFSHFGRTGAENKGAFWSHSLTFRQWRLCLEKGREKIMSVETLLIY